MPPLSTPPPPRPYTRLVPKVSNLSAQGTLRLGLTRLVPELPGFGALLISFARVPQVSYLA
jgi:hypothetical protein